MPIPSPHSNENRNMFMTRCMGDDIMNREFPEEKQRTAVCMRQWGRDMANTLEGVEIFRAGTWNEDKFTEADLDDMVNAFKDLDFKPPLKLGHVKDAPGMPALGWVANLRRSGDKLLADFTDIPDRIFQAIKEKMFDRVSAEIWFNLKRGEKMFRRALKAVALLGADIPAVAGLKPLAELFAEFGAEAEKEVTIDNKFSKKEEIIMVEPKTVSVEEFAELKTSLKSLQDNLETLKLENDTLKVQAVEAAKDKTRIAELEAAQKTARTDGKVEKVQVPALRPHIRSLYAIVAGGGDTMKVKVFDGKEHKEITAEEVVDSLVSFLNDTTTRKLFAELTPVDTKKTSAIPDDLQAVADMVDEKTREYMDKNKETDYSKALSHVLNSDPELKEAYARS